MTCGRPKKICAGSMRHRISVIRRELGAPAHGSAEASYTPTTLLTTRAQIETKGGTTEFNRVVIDGQNVSHVFTIRHTSVALDSRNMIEDAAGNLYRILKVENPNEFNDYLKLYCVRSGEETRKAAQ